jgi:hypothetical protein
MEEVAKEENPRVLAKQAAGSRRQEPNAKRVKSDAIRSTLSTFKKGGAKRKATQ